MIKQRLFYTQRYRSTSSVKGYHLNKDIWAPAMNEILSAKMAHENEVEGGKTGKLAKMIFYFLHAGQYSICEAIVTCKPKNLGFSDRMRVPCNLRIVWIKITAFIKQSVSIILRSFPS